MNLMMREREVFHFTIDSFPSINVSENHYLCSIWMRAMCAFGFILYFDFYFLFFAVRKEMKMEMK